MSRFCEQIRILPAAPWFLRNGISASFSSSRVQDLGYFIGGEERLGKGAQFVSKNPAVPSDVIRTVHGCSNEDIDTAVGAAREGFKIWSKMTGSQRGQIIHRAAQILRERRNVIAELESRDSGHCISEVYPAHIDFGITTLEYYAGIAPMALEGKHIPLENNNYAICRREPLGVVAGVVAWNYPFQMALYKAAISLAAGNSVVMKPSSKTPVSTMELAKAFTDAGMPNGVFNVVQGGSAVGTALVEHPGVDKVSFTGSTNVGEQILRMCSSNIRPCTVELGGKSPLIIFDDAKIDNAVQAALIANFFTAGQICTNGTRIFVQERIYGEFMDRFVAAANKLRVGDPLNETTQIGSLIDGGHADEVRGFIQTGVKEGADLMCGGLDPVSSLADKFDPKAFLRPTVFGNVKDEMTIAKEEIFGPVASVLKFSTEEEVVSRANNTPYGLAAGFFTNNLSRASRVSSQLQAGIVWVNNYNFYSPEVPVGGYKQSGFGREFGAEALEHVTQTKSVVVEMNDVPIWE